MVTEVRTVAFYPGSVSALNHGLTHRHSLNGIVIRKGTHLRRPRIPRSVAGKKFGGFGVAVNFAGHADLVDDVGGQIQHLEQILPSQFDPAAAARQGVNGVIEQLGMALAKMILDVIRSNVSKDHRLPPAEHAAVPPSTALPSPQELVGRLAESAAPAAPRQKKKRVTVIGLKPSQAGRIAEDFHDCFDLDFWNDRAGDGLEKLREMAGSADFVIEHKRHMGHRAENIVTSLGIKPIRVSGGVTSIRETLTSLYCTLAAS